MLGHRGVRLGITYPEIYEMQIRAILEAAAAVRKEGVEGPSRDHGAAGRPPSKELKRIRRPSSIAVTEVMSARTASDVEVSSSAR